VLLEAETTLATTELYTPSICSKWTTESTGSEEVMWRRRLLAAIVMHGAAEKHERSSSLKL
jgi:hypothetical protein